MTWVAAVGAGIGLAGNLMGNSAKKKAAAQQANLAREQSQKMRDRATETANVTKAEIENMRTLRSMDMPAFRQASESAMIQAQKGAERMARQRTMGRLAPDVRQAIFGGQFQQYVGREMQRLEQHAGLTQQIMQATQQQQQMANQVEQAAGGMEYQGMSQAIQMRQAAGEDMASILGAVGGAVSQYASAQTAQKQAAADSKRQFASDAILQEYGKEGKSLPFLEGGTVNKDKLNAFFEGMGY